MVLKYSLTGRCDIAAMVRRTIIQCEQSDLYIPFTCASFSFTIYGDFAINTLGRSGHIKLPDGPTSFAETLCMLITWLKLFSFFALSYSCHICRHCSNASPAERVRRDIKSATVQSSRVVSEISQGEKAAKS